MNEVIGKSNIYFHKYRNYIILSFIFIVASFFRLYRLDSIPFGLNNDAAWEGSAAINILQGNAGDYLPYAMEGWRGEGIIRIIVAFFTLFLGNNPITIKLASVIFGVGLIIPLFFLIKNLFDTKLAAITTFLVAVSGWHITISKTGWRAITVPFFATLLFYFYFRGIKSKKTSDFIIAGVILSISSLYTYDAGRVILFFFIFWIIFSLSSVKKFISTYKKQISFLLISFLITSLPMAFYALGNWQNFTSRSDFLFIGNQVQQTGNLSPLINNVINAFLTFNVAANGNDFFIFRPLVDAPISWLIPIGFIVCLWKIIFKKSLNYFFIMVWFLFSMIPGIFSAPNGNREIGTIPSVFFFAGLGIIFIVDLFDRIFHLGEKVKIMTIFLFLLTSSLVTYNLYLSKNRLELPGFYPETLVTTNYIKTIWNDYDIYVTDNYPRELLTYYLYRNNQRDTFVRNYVWLDNSLAFLNVQPNIQNDIALTEQNTGGDILGASTQKKRGVAFFMFANDFNEQTAREILSRYSNARKFYLLYTDDNINRLASLVILVPPK